MENQDDVAIIGVALRLPKADSIDKLEQILANKMCCVESISEERKEMALLCKEVLGYGSAQFADGAYLEDVTSFDHMLFNLSPLEATAMDVNQRLFLETAVDAIEDAGYGAERLSGTNTGVYYAGTGKMEYLELIKKVNPSLESVAELGNLPSFAAGRLAYRYNLTGPAIYINTLCSSSLVALHTACEDIKNKECDMAVVGGSRVELFPYIKNSIGIESKDAKTRTFSDEASGTGGGEGSIVLMIKRLSDAQRDDDYIYAVIKGSAVNQDGKCAGLTSPNQYAQAKVIKKAWEHANINPLDIGYIEAHGTGTKLGDPIEITGLTNAFSELNYQNQFCYIGSVKTNFGHLDCVSGLLSVLKIILTVKNRKIYPQLFFDKPSRYIDFEHSPVKVCTELVDWSECSTDRVCGVSAFGFSGTNCHMVIKEYENADACKGLESFRQNGEPCFMCLSSENPEKLQILVKKYMTFIEENSNISLDELCFSANISNSCYEERIIFSADSLKQLYDKMNRFVQESNYKDNMRKDYYQQFFKGDLLKLIYQYIDGENVDFKKLYHNVRGNRISVPLYPFKKRKFWIASFIKQINKR